jgi:3'-5' exoribonuclease
MSPMQHTNINALQPNHYVEGTYSLVNPQMGTTRNGKPFLKCLLRDATGEVPCRHWSFDEAGFREIETASFVYISGHTQLYNGQTQLILEIVRPTEVDEADMVMLLPSTTKDIDTMFNDLQALLGSLDHPAMKGLADAYLSDEELMHSFRQAPAAVNLHHAWIGGLLEHTLQTMKLADAMLPLYPQLNRDLVLMGLFLHDLGKTTELTWAQGFNYTTDGNLIGHVVRGAIWLQVKAAIAGKQSGHKIPPDALRVLQHIIISHHGEPEYGAAKIPSTPEAIFVSLLDNLDAKTQMALSAARPEDETAMRQSEFTDKLWALNTRLFTPDPLEASIGVNADT